VSPHDFFGINKRTKIHEVYKNINLRCGCIQGWHLHLNNNKQQILIYYNIICYYIPWIVLQSVTVYSAVLAVRRGAPAAIYIYVCIPSTPLISTIYICVGFCKVAGALNIHKHMFDIIIYFALSRPRSTCKLQRETR